MFFNSYITEPVKHHVLSILPNYFSVHEGYRFHMKSVLLWGCCMPSFLCQLCHNVMLYLLASSVISFITVPSFMMGLLI